MVMQTTKQNIIIKGNKEGLQFYMDADCSYEDLLAELDQKLKGSHFQFLQGPLMHVYIHLGFRYLSKEQKDQITQMIHDSGNLLVKQIHSELMTVDEAKKLIHSEQTRVVVGMVRSGQVLESDQDILLLGDVNPGGFVISEGSIFVMGALKGTAHAGYAGDRNKIIAASLMEPTQLRIADVIFQSDLNDASKKNQMEFAYLREGRIEINPIQSLKYIRPDLSR
jgi:septum site-determining protein MinC